MTEQDTDNMRPMTQMRDRDQVENAAYALGALSNEDKVKAIELFNKIWDNAARRQYATVTIQFTGYDK